MNNYDEVIRSLTRSYTIYGLNPEPWSPGVKVKRGPLVAYQNALKEELMEECQGQWPVGSPIRLRFQFWRELESNQDADGRWHRGQYADATNLQKATEDALQGVLFANDRYVTDIQTSIEDQGLNVVPQIVIHISEGHECQSQPTSVSHAISTPDNPSTASRSRKSSTTGRRKFGP